MAIKNTALGGTDWTDTTVLAAADLNDTFNAAVTKIQSYSAFWLNTDLYDVYDDFESYSTGTFADNTKWDLTTTASGNGQATATIESSTNAGGSGKELKLYANSGTTSAGTDSGLVTAKMLTLGANKHTWCRLYISMDILENIETPATYGIIAVSLNASSYVTIPFLVNDESTTSGTHRTGYANTDLLVVAKGSNVYDVYVGGKKISSDNNPGANLYLTFKLFNSEDSGDGFSQQTTMYIDDVRQSKSTITA